MPACYKQHRDSPSCLQKNKKTYAELRKYSKNKKEKGIENHRKISDFQRLNWRRDPVCTFARYLKSRYDTLKYCGFVIYD